MGLDDDNVKSGNEEDNVKSDNEEASGGTLSRYKSESSVAATEEEDDDEDRKIELGPQCTLKEQLEKDKVFASFFSYFVVFEISENKIKI
jgi:Rho GDP-dissociation inhibitor